MNCGNGEHAVGFCYGKICGMSNDFGFHHNWAFKSCNWDPLETYVQINMNAFIPAEELCKRQRPDLCNIIIIIILNYTLDRHNFV